MKGGISLAESFDTSDFVSEAIEKHADLVRRICYLHLKNRADVEDVFQEVFLQFFLNFHIFQSEEHQKAWLCRVTYNRCKDYYRSFWKRKVVSLHSVEIPYETPEQASIMEAIKKLSPEGRQLIYLHYYEGRTIPEISEMMDTNLNTLYSLLRRCKAQLQKEVGEIEL
jgi:RNA polymerase sigma-70 factor (ECF subfamily)